MFKKLRNRLILINLGITTVVILMVFTTIYLITTRAAEMRAPMPNVPEEVETMVDISVREERRATAEQLLITLVFSGVAIEIAVALVSYALAEEAIKPVREAYDAQKIFIANASHEIKTPLAAIAANLEAADIKNNKWIANVERETEKLSELNSSLLMLARTDLMTTSTIEEVDLSKVLVDNIESFVPRLKNLVFTKKIMLNEKIKINREDFVQIFSCLMDNAVKYADKKVCLELSPHLLKLSNDGETIPEEKLKHLFERFYQVDKTREGVGLGLSIAKTLAERNHWNLKAESQDGITTFTLEF